MDFLAKRGRFCRHSLSYVKKSNEVAAKKTHKDIKRYPPRRIKTISNNQVCFFSFYNRFISILHTFT